MFNLDLSFDSSVIEEQLYIKKITELYNAYRNFNSKDASFNTDRFDSAILDFMQNKLTYYTDPEYINSTLIEDLYYYLCKRQRIKYQNDYRLYINIIKILKDKFPNIVKQFIPCIIRLQDYVVKYNSDLVIQKKSSNSQMIIDIYHEDITSIGKLCKYATNVLSEVDFADTDFSFLNEDTAILFCKHSLPAMLSLTRYSPNGIYPHLALSVENIVSVFLMPKLIGISQVNKELGLFRNMNITEADIDLNSPLVEFTFTQLFKNIDFIDRFIYSFKRIFSVDRDIDDPLVQEIVKYIQNKILTAPKDVMREAIIHLYTNTWNNIPHYYPQRVIDNILSDDFIENREVKAIIVEIDLSN